jgi:orotidine-5'-phosphate decarboxylase
LSIEKKSGIILALDLMEKKPALKLAESLSEEIDAIKIGYPLVLNVSLGIVNELKSLCKIPVIADFKIADIPYIARKIVKIAIENGCDGLIVHGFMGPDGVEACIQEAGDKMIFVATELTSPGGQIFTQTVSEDIAEMAKELGAYGIQAPGTRPERVRKLRKIVGEDLIIIACGIGRQGSKPGTAIGAGADFEIIGRAIYESSDPLKSVRKIRELTTGAMFLRH